MAKSKDWLADRSSLGSKVSAAGNSLDPSPMEETGDESVEAI
jgi:hypothetical protein